MSASKKEGLPFNIMESLGCGKITLASDVKGHRDLIEDGKSGILYQPEDITDFINKVKAIHKGEISIDPEDAISRYNIYSKALQDQRLRLRRLRDLRRPGQLLGLRPSGCGVH